MKSGDTKIPSQTSAPKYEKNFDEIIVLAKELRELEQVEEAEVDEENDRKHNTSRTEAGSQE